VSVYSVVTGQEMWHAITNSSGMVYVMNLPLNASYIQPSGKAYVMLKVRTISPQQTVLTSTRKCLLNMGRPIRHTKAN